MKLVLGGITAEIEIKGYTKENRTEYGCTWCQVDFSFKEKPWLQYEKKNNEVLTAEEIDMLLEKLEQLLQGQLQGRTELNFIEPDFQFVLFKNESVLCMDWLVHLWEKEKGLTGNYFSVRLYHDEIEIFWKYLKEIQGKT